jgi:hypothetical protein
LPSAIPVPFHKNAANDPNSSFWKTTSAKTPNPMSMPHKKVQLFCVRRIFISLSPIHYTTRAHADGFWSTRLPLLPSPSSSALGRRWRRRFGLNVIYSIQT